MKELRFPLQREERNPKPVGYLQNFSSPERYALWESPSPFIAVRCASEGADRVEGRNKRRRGCGNMAGQYAGRLDEQMIPAALLVIAVVLPQGEVGRAGPGRGTAVLRSGRRLSQYLRLPAM